jgi:hypothetical protein
MWGIWRRVSRIAPSSRGLRRRLRRRPENAGHVAHAAEVFLQLTGETGGFEKLAHRGLAEFERFEIEGRRGEPLFQKAGAGGRHGGVHRGEEAAFALSLAAPKNLEITLGRRIEEQGSAEPVFANPADVGRPGPEALGRVSEERPGGAESGEILGQAEAFEIEHPEGLEDEATAFATVELVVGLGRDESPVPQAGPALRKAVPKGFERLAPLGQRVPFGNDQLTRIEGIENTEQGLRIFCRGDLEGAGREVEPGGVEPLLVRFDGKEEMVGVGLELMVFEGRPGRQDPRQFPLDQLPGLGGLDLVDDRHFFPGAEDFLQVVVGGVIRDAGHRLAVPIRQGDSQNVGPDLGVLLKHLVEIAQPEEQQGVRREAPPYLVILLHHGGEFFRHQDRPNSQ